MPSLAFVVRVCAMAAVLAATGSAANAAAPVPVGKRALLTLNIQIDGAGQRASRSDGIDVKWSTHRVLDAKVELVAAKAQGTSAADVKGQVAAASGYKPSADLAALQKEAEKCKPNDTACQMAIAMKMMDTDDAKKMMQQDQAAQAAAPRYQTWETAPNSGKVEATGEYQEQWDGVFLTASREVRNCKSAFPGTPTGTTSGTAIAAKDRETLQTGLKGNSVEIDTQTGKSSLLLVVASYVAGELKCHINDGGRVSDERDNKTLSFRPPLDTTSTGGWVTGGVAAGAAISRGEVTLLTKADAQSITGMMSVTAPLKVKIRWELVPL
jgi:hypothetical protein